MNALRIRLRLQLCTLIALPRASPFLHPLEAWFQCQIKWLQKYCWWLKVIQLFLRWRGEDGVEHRHHHRGLQGHVQRLLLLPLRHVRLGGRHQQHRPVTVQRFWGKEGKIFQKQSIWQMPGVLWHWKKDPSVSRQWNEWKWRSSFLARYNTWLEGRLWN